MFMDFLFKDYDKIFKMILKFKDYISQLSDNKTGFVNLCKK